MSRQNYVFTSESVSEGHPDKVRDRISDAVLDALIAQEPNARVAYETFATTDQVVVGGKVGLADKARLDDFLHHVDGIVRDCVRDIGYEQEHFHWQTLRFTNFLHPQSAHISQGVDKDGAEDGDQGKHGEHGGAEHGEAVTQETAHGRTQPAAGTGQGERHHWCRMRGSVTA